MTRPSLRIRPHLRALLLAHVCAFTPVLGNAQNLVPPLVCRAEYTPDDRPPHKEAAVDLSVSKIDEGILVKVESRPINMSFTFFRKGRTEPKVQLDKSTEERIHFVEVWDDNLGTNIFLFELDRLSGSFRLKFIGSVLGVTGHVWGRCEPSGRKF